MTLGIESNSFTPDKLIAGDFPLKTESAVIQAGAGVISRGGVLGIISKDVGTVEQDSGNTGDATIGTTSILKTAQLGVYKIVALDATNLEVFDPAGKKMKNAVVGSPYDGGDIVFTITAGATPLVAGDFFTFEVADHADKGKMKLAAVAAVDGSDVPARILANDVDATLEAVTTIAYIKGEFNDNALSFGVGHDASSVKDALAAEDIILRTPAVKY